MPLIINIKFHIIIYEDSNESHPSMVALHNMIIEYLIIMHQAIHSFELLHVDY